MRRNKGLHAFSLMFVVILAIVMLAGCSSDKNNNKEEATNSPAPTTTTPNTTESVVADADPFAEHMEISIGLWAIGDAVFDVTKDAVADAVLKKLNITIKPVNTTWDDYTQKIQLWAASDQLPDLFAIDAVTSPNLKSWVEQGVIRELPADLSAYPELEKMMATPDFQGYKYPLGDVNGKFVSIPRPSFRDANLSASTRGILVRKDWMENVGITKAPETMDEFIALMMAFVEKDPDQNNKNDTIGLTTYNPSWLGFLMGAYEPGLMSGSSAWVRGGDKWVPAFTTDRATEGIKAIKRLYDAGGLDRDFATMKGGEAVDKFAAGLAGAYIHDVSPSGLNGTKKKFEQLNPDKKFEDYFMILPPLKNVDGNVYRNYESAIWSESYISSKVDDKKLDRILRMFDYFISEEGFNLLNYGIENVDYVKQGDEIVLVDQKDESGKPIAIWTKYPFLNLGYLAEWSGTAAFDGPMYPITLRNMANDNVNWLIENANPIDTDLRLVFIDYPSRAKAIEKFDDDLVKAITSKDAEKAWTDMTNTYLSNGYDKIIEEFNAAAAALGINP